MTNHHRRRRFLRGLSAGLTGAVAGCAGGGVVDGPGQPNTVEELAAGDGDPGDAFRRRVAVQEGTVLVGAPRDEEPNGPAGGSVYVFARSDGGWTQWAKLAAHGDEPADRFGNAVALVGARNDDDPHGATTDPVRGGGAAYAFRRSGGEWTQRAKLVADDGDAGDDFGRDVAGDAALVGARNDEDPTAPGAGAAYAFVRSDDGWTQRRKVAAPGGEPGDRFGIAVAVSRRRTAVVGAPGPRDGDRRGSAYVFER